MPLFSSILIRNSRRYFSQTTSKHILKTVYISRSTDIFTNLALEDWLYKNVDLSNQTILMLWQSEPCIVIGRHQNPWIECNFSMLPNISNGVKLARRNSGGGTVYHDMGNLNLTFLTSRKQYSRKKNLELISRSLNTTFGINSEITSREDLCVNNLKISGTASKLGRNSAYHHCTILVNVNKEHLSLALKMTSIQSIVKTNATRSVKSGIMNLSEQVRTINIDQVMQAIINEFNKSDGQTCYSGNLKIIDSVDENQFPGITEIKNEFLSKLWRYEKTPKFEIIQTIQFGDDSQVTHEKNDEFLEAFLVIEGGTVNDAGLKYNADVINTKQINVKHLQDIFNGLIGKDFSQDVLDEFNMILCGLRSSEICRNIVNVADG